MKKFLLLWKITPSDCKWDLIIEFILYPDKFKQRYLNEITFKTNMKNRWG